MHLEWLKSCLNDDIPIQKNKQLYQIMTKLKQNIL